MSLTIANNQIAELSLTLKQQKSRKREAVPFVYKPFSYRQKQVLTWWSPNSPVKDKDGIISDGAIRSGKTLVFSLSFGLWAMTNFKEMNFLICGKTIGALRRNVVLDWSRQMSAHGFKVKERRTDSLLIVSTDEYSNYFYMFGGYDEHSQDVVQGITAAGVLFDEVALMPRSFVDQAVGRCSVDGSKFWFNCNPDHPKHWFKVEWIDKLPENRQADDAPDKQYKNLVYAHFTMDDNPSLTQRVKERYRSMHTGVFYRRFVLGLWCAADGLIYDGFEEDVHTYTELPKGVAENRRYIAVDYGTSNPMTFLELIDDGDVVWVDREYYYSSKEHGRQKTDSEYAEDFVMFAENVDTLDKVVLDPSAASFKTELRNRGFRVKDADNDVRNGISKVSTMFALKKLMINRRCRYLINELLSYIWDEKAAENGFERPVKQNDHACDALRYGIATVIYTKRRFAN
ncbi:MAG: PBSX family phage terminase large subunit [Clostridium sp.]|jgi:PBSX family phage terminase large subunit|nr:PBSX family phage terminase large subunit [Clostridium sp.]